MASASPISVMPRKTIDREADLLPPVTVNWIYRDGGIRSILLAQIKYVWLGSVCIISLSSAMSFAPLDLLIFIKITYH